MDGDITLKNYRCFPDSRPARFAIRKGFTAFVGVNNSGKSSLLRFFYEFRNLFGHVCNVPELQPALRGARQVFDRAPSVFDIEELFCNTNNRDLQIELDVPTPARLVLTIPRGTDTWLARFDIPNMQLDPQRLRIDATTLLHADKPVADLGYLFEVLRTLADTLYIGPFRNAINIGTNQNYFDIQVGQAFIQTWKHYKTGNIRKHNEATYKLTQDIKRIFEFQELEINPSPDDQTLQVFINGRSYKLPELGSGLTQFILVLANAATRQPAYVLIDEPELNLHPSLQLDFLTTLGSYAREGVLFGTQSVGLARASADRIYSLRRLSEGESHLAEFESNPRLSEFLGELSFSGYRELGFDQILLVEGRTDIKTIQQFLRLYHKDHKIVLLPLGGATLINRDREPELQEIKRISNSIFALIDSERTRQGQQLDSRRQDFVEVCKRVEIGCYVLDHRAIENYFSDRAVKKVKGDKYGALHPWQALKDANPAWAKEENWRIAREMTREEIDQTDLGRFLASL